MAMRCNHSYTDYWSVEAGGARFDSRQNSKEPHLFKPHTPRARRLVRAGESALMRGFCAAQLDSGIPERMLRFNFFKDKR